MTAQFREKITIEGEKYGMASEPLDPLIVLEFSGHKDGFPDGYPTLYPSCTACWRGYIGHWLVDDHQLWLVDVRGSNEVDDGKIYVEVDQEQLKLLDWRKTFFNHQQGNIKAEWFSGQLVVEMGELIKYVHMAYYSEYEKYMIIDIKDGDVVKQEMLTNEEYQQYSKKV